MGAPIGPPIGRIAHPDHLGRILGDFTRRLRILENGPTGPLLAGTGGALGGSFTGVAGPPTGLSGFGGEVPIASMTFTLQVPAMVLLIALIGAQVTVSTGPFIATHPLYWNVDGADNSGAWTNVGVFAAGDAEIRALTATLMLPVNFPAGAGPHTAEVIWNSEEGAHDTLTLASAFLFALQLA